MVNPQVPRVTGRDLAIGLFELKNNPSLIGRLRFEQLQSEFHDLTDHTVDVVIVGEAPKSQEEQPYPPALYPRLAMGSGNFEFPVEAEAAGNLEVLLVLYATVGVTDSVVLLDEPALNLHPSKQQRLYTFIRDYSKTNHNQVFIVTHSTTFVTPDDLVTAVRVEPGSSGSRLRQIRYPTAAARAKAKGTGLFNHEVLSALFAERALIYEGHDEAAALPVWFERCPRGELVVSANVVHINARGMTSIPEIVKMLRTWGIPYRAIADRKARDVLKPLGPRAMTFRWTDMTGLVNSALPGKLSQQQKKLGTRQKSPINFFAIAHRVPPPAPVLALWKRLLPFIEGKKN
ncbi:MAG: ATP-binding protein [Thermoplasmata archaeon]|nr:ATP-binding protein [Thermoplasmata archaeon]